MRLPAVVQVPDRDWASRRAEREAKRRLLGNAVPPLMAEAVGGCVGRALQGANNQVAAILDS